MPGQGGAGELRPGGLRLLTVPEAAALIGLSERTLYRLLKADNIAARTVMERRQTATGRRATTLVPASLVEELRASHGPAQSEPAAPPGAAKPASPDGDDAANSAATTAPDRDSDSVALARGAMPAAVYQQRIIGLEAVNAEQAARIADQADRIAGLERDKGELFEALRREQTLRALAAPQNSPSGPQNPQNPTPADGEAAEQDAGMAAGAPPAGFWGRLWARMRE